MVWVGLEVPGFESRDRLLAFFLPSLSFIFYINPWHYLYTLVYTLAIEHKSSTAHSLHK